MAEINLKKLNSEQKRAVIHDQGPLLIIAGAGTGKTTVITQRLAYLIQEKKCHPEEVLALTFTDKAAGEMEERLDQFLPYGYINLWVSTFHSFAERILKEHGLAIGLPGDFKLLDSTQQWLLVRKNLDRFNLDYYRPLGNPTKFIRDLLKLFSRAKDEAVTPTDYLKYAEELKLNTDSSDFVKSLATPEVLETLSRAEQRELITQEIQKTEEVASAFHVYQQLLLENNALDFGDLINYCLALFRRRPAILAKYRQQFKYLLVDEFQDTNYAQYELIKMLAKPRNNITVVGDDDQSIYKFRGASISNILEFKKDYPRAQEIFLTKNYRSSQNILDLAYGFIQQNNPNRLEVKLAEKNNQKLSKRLIATTKESGKIEHFHFNSAADELMGVVEKIIALKNRNDQVSWNDFAILSRTNEGANFFAQGLNRAQIPNLFVAARGLYFQPIILDLIAYLRLLDNYHESEAVFRVLKSPLVAMDYGELINFNAWAKRKGESLFAALKHHEPLGRANTETQEKVRRFLALLEKHSKLAQERPVSELVLKFLETSGYLDKLSLSDSAETVRNAGYLNQFYKKIEEFELTSPDRTVRNFLSLFELELEAGEGGALIQDFEAGPEAVKIMTVHSAKGLEFKYIFIVNLVDRRFPSDDRPDRLPLPDKFVKETLPEGDIHLQEERRLFYVAMTRAKRGLYFTSAEDYGGQRRKKISRFLLELEVLGLALDKKATIRKTEARIKITSAEPAAEQEIKYLLPKKFSFTQLKSFINCPYHYWLEYVLKIPQPGRPFFSFGRSLHLTLQYFFQLVQERARANQPDLFGGGQAKEKPLATQEELLALYEKNWLDDWYLDRRQHDEYFKRGREALKIFYQEYVKTLPIPKFLEKNFTLVIKDEKNNPYQIIGKIDRIDQTAEGLVIIDYKTGQVPSSQKKSQTISSDDKNQLLIYQLAAEQIFREKIKQLVYYYLENGRQIGFLGSDKELAAIQEKIIKTIQEIKNYSWPAKPEDCRCRHNLF